MESSSESEAEKNEEYNPMGEDETGIETPLSGLETPTNIEGQLRKRKKDLYEVLEEQETHVSSRDIYGSTHKYVIDKKQLKGMAGTSDHVELSIDPNELETLTEEALKKRLTDQFHAERKGKGDEDDEESKKRKRQPTREKSKKKKKTTEYKF